MLLACPFASGILSSKAVSDAVPLSSFLYCFAVLVLVCFTLEQSAGVEASSLLMHAHAQD